MVHKSNFNSITEVDGYVKSQLNFFELQRKCINDYGLSYGNPNYIKIYGGRKISNLMPYSTYLHVFPI